MTLARSFSKPLFLRGIRDHRGIILLYNIAMFFLGPFLAMFFMSNFGEVYSYDINAENFDSLRIIMEVWVSALSVVAASISACKLCSKYCQPKSACFYEALPYTRTTLFINDNLCALAVFGGSLFINCFISYFIIAAYMNFTSALTLLATMGGVFLTAVVNFIAVYAVFMFCGQLSYNTATQIILGICFLFYLTVSVYLSVFAVTVFDPGFNGDAYNAFAVKLSPVFEIIRRPFFETPQERVVSSLVWLGISAVAIVLSCILFRKKRVENSGRALSFLWVRYLVRVMFMFPVGIFTALALYFISGGNFIWCLIGALIGCFLTHIVINAIVFRSAAKILYGPISLVIIALSAVLTLCALRYDLFGITKIPDREEVSSIEIHSDSDEFHHSVFKSSSDEVTDILYRLIEASRDDENNPNSYSSYFDASAVFYTAGIPVSKNLNLDFMSEAAAPIMEELRSHPEYIKYKYSELLDMCSDKYEVVTCDVLNVSAKADSEKSFGTVNKEKLLSALKADVQSLKRYSTVSVAKIGISGHLAGKEPSIYEGGMYIQVDLSRGFKETLAYLESLGYCFDEKVIASTASEVVFVGYGYVKLDGEDGDKTAQQVMEACRKEILYREYRTAVYVISNEGVITEAEMSNSDAARLIGEAKDKGIFIGTWEDTLYSEKSFGS